MADILKIYTRYRSCLWILLLTLSVKYANGLTCYCQGHCPYDNFNGTCEARPFSQCFAAVEEVYNPDTGLPEPEYTYGCLPPEEKGLMQCKGHLVPHLVPKSIQCCHESDHCNRLLSPMYEIRSTTPDPNSGFGSDQNVHYLALLVSGTASVIILFVMVVCVYVHYKRKEDKRQVSIIKAPCAPYLGGNSTIKDMVDHSQSSGSGSGLPLLVQRTIAKQLVMGHSIGKGRYGEVWMAKWREEKVAVKVFFTTEEASWFRETDIYQTVLMRHSHILGFIAADIKGTGSWTQMLLITDYHELGSLHDFLQQYAPDGVASGRLAFTAASGLAHLHTEIFGTRGKPAIAHRDIKSKNILVKRDWTCAIADFGLAVRYISESQEIDIAPNTRVGTRRYMAPEVLDESLNKFAFEAFKAADIYSFGLVLWEIARRCNTASSTISEIITDESQEKLVTYGPDDYQQPYYDCVPSDPSFDDMYNVVCVKKVRPDIQPHWLAEEPLKTLAQVMQECWHQNPAARLTALRVKKSLTRINDESDMYMYTEKYNDKELLPSV